MQQLQNILVVDDEENIRHMLGTVLRKEGYEVVVADSAEQALKVILKAAGLTGVFDDATGVWHIKPEVKREAGTRPGGAAISPTVTAGDAPKPPTRAAGVTSGRGCCWNR